MAKKSDRIPFPHPGETIREDYLKPLGMSVNALALDLRVPATRMLEIVNGRRGITADTALRLARYFNTTPKFWLNLQTSCDLAVTAEAKQEQIARMVHPREAAYARLAGYLHLVAAQVLIIEALEPFADLFVAADLGQLRRRLRSVQHRLIHVNRAIQPQCDRQSVARP